MKNLFPGALLATFLLVPGAAWAGNDGGCDSCKCESCGKDCKCHGECKCKKGHDGECSPDCGCDKKK